MPFKSWLSASKILLLAGVAALATSAGFVQIAGGASTDFYPGPCTTAPSNVTVTYLGTTSGCTTSTACQAGEAVRFTAAASGYNFAVCDRFVWTFGDDGTTQTTFSPEIVHTFGGPGPRTVNLTVRNDFGQTSAPTVTLFPTTIAVKCVKSDFVLCLGKGIDTAQLPAGSDGRFRVTLTAKDNPERTQNTGIGKAIVKGDLFGYFSIPAITNNPNNPEVFVKMVDARVPPFNSFWLFWGSMTDFDYTITVLDTVTGNQETINRPPGKAYGGAETSLFSRTFYTQTPETCNVPPVKTTETSRVACSGNTNTLCLLNNRFKIAINVTNQYSTPPNQQSTAQAIREPNNDIFGFFSFPGATGDATRPEVFVKIIDAGAGFWVFYGGLTDLQYSMTVTDTQTGRINTYTKNPFSYCGGFDTAAF